MKCPHCHEEIDEAYYRKEMSGWIQLGKQDKEGKTKIDLWNDNANEEFTIYCPECDEEITNHIKVQRR